MAPIFKYTFGALCVFAICPSFAAPIQADTALVPRQLAGVGDASDAILTDTDNGVGYGVENAEDNTANTISGTKGQAGARSVAARQLDKIANGAGAVANSVGAEPEGDQVQSTGDTVDGDGTSDSATVGEQVGATEETTLEDAGSDVP